MRISLTSILLTSLVMGCGGDGPTQSPPPRDFPPRVLESFMIEQPLIADRETLDLNFASTFEDPEGRSMTYTATSSDDRIATVTLTGFIATVYPHDEGIVTITIYATDPGGNQANVKINLVVEPSPVHPDDAKVYTYLNGLEVSPNEISFFKREDNGVIGRGPTAYIDIDPEEFYFRDDSGYAKFLFIKSRWQKQDDYGPHQGWLHVPGTEKTGTRLQLYTPGFGAGEDHQSGCYRMVGEIDISYHEAATGEFFEKEKVFFASNVLAYRLPGHVRCE